MYIRSYQLPHAFLLFTFFLFACERESPVLIKIHDGPFDEVGVKSGYVNLKGDTIIPLGKYYYCYTDTFVTHAVVLKQGGGCVAIDGHERELFEVVWFDNGPDPICEGLFRIRQNDKIGYANRRGEMIIEPQFACAFPFENGKAKVAFHCERVAEGEHTRLDSDQWFYIDKRGRRLD